MSASPSSALARLAGRRSLARRVGPATPRSSGTPFFVPAYCTACGAALTQLKASLAAGWHDEWECRRCRNGLILDVPTGYFGRGRSARPARKRQVKKGPGRMRS